MFLRNIYAVKKKNHLSPKFWSQKSELS